MRRRPQLMARPRAVAAASTRSQVGELSGATAGATAGRRRSDWQCQAMEAICTYEDWSFVVQEAMNGAVDTILRRRATSDSSLFCSRLCASCNQALRAQLPLVLTQETTKNQMLNGIFGWCAVAGDQRDHAEERVRNMSDLLAKSRADAQRCRRRRRRSWRLFALCAGG